MDSKKFEKLIDLIINENEEQARELFHDIVVEKSREIYESIMDEEMMEGFGEEDEGIDRKSTRLNSSHSQQSRMPSSA